MSYQMLKNIFCRLVWIIVQIFIIAFATFIPGCIIWAPLVAILHKLTGNLVISYSVAITVAACAVLLVSYSDSFKEMFARKRLKEYLQENGPKTVDEAKKILATIDQKGIFERLNYLENRYAQSKSRWDNDIAEMMRKRGDFV